MKVKAPELVEVLPIKKGPNAGLWTIHIDGEPSLYYCPNEHAAQRVCNRLLDPSAARSRALHEKLDPNQPTRGTASIVESKANKDVVVINVDGDECECPKGDKEKVADLMAFARRGKLGRRKEIEAKFKKVAGENATVAFSDEKGLHGECDGKQFAILTSPETGAPINVKQLTE